MSKKFRDIVSGQTFRFAKIDKDYTLLKTGDFSWEVISSNCSTYNAGQSVICKGESIKYLLSARITDIT